MGNHRKTIGKLSWERHGITTENYTKNNENHGITMENDRKTMGKAWEDYEEL